MTYFRKPKTDPNNLTRMEVVTRNDRELKDINLLLSKGYIKITVEEFKIAKNRR